MAPSGGRVSSDLMNISMLYGLSEATGYDGMTPRLIERLVRPGGGLTLGGHGTLRGPGVLRSDEHLDALRALGGHRLRRHDAAAHRAPRSARRRPDPGRTWHPRGAGCPPI